MALKWFEQLKEAAMKRSRNVIIFHFNIRDIVFDGDDPGFLRTSPSELNNVSDFLLNQLMIPRDWVLRYSASTGFTAYVRRGDQVLPFYDGAPITGVVGATPSGDTLTPVMKEAATRPYPLATASGVADDPNRPFTWRSLDLTWPLLDRIIDRQWNWNREGAKQNETVKFAVIIDYLDHLIPAQAQLPIQQQALEHMMRWSYSSTLTKANSRVIALTSEIEAVHRDLYGKDSRIEVIEIPWPQREERHTFIKYLASHANEFPNLSQYSSDALKEFSNLTSGLNYAEIRDFAKTLDAPATGTTKDTWKEPLRIRRQEMIVRQSGSLLVPRHSKFGMDDVAGYDYVKDLLNARKDALRDGKADVSGILFTGPPGTGKSFFASCLARDIGIEMVTMQTIRGSYVGESERNFERVLRVATNMHPVIIFVDEIDQTFSSSRGHAGDGGVEQRLFGRLLEFMEDRNNLGKVLWLAASNRPDNLDAALLSRFRIRIPFLLPDTAALKAMLHIQIPAQCGFQWEPSSWAKYEAEIDAQIANKLLGKFSGREVDTLVRNAFVKAKEATPSVVDNLMVDASVLLPAINAANMTSNYQDYIRWSLLALRDIDASEPKLMRSVKEVMPPIIVNEIIDHQGGLSPSGITNVLGRLKELLP